MADGQAAVLVTDANVVTGRGLVTQKAFRQGDIIFEEDALVIYHTSFRYDEREADGDDFYKGELARNTQDLSDVFYKLNNAGQEGFKKLYCSDPKATNLQQIVNRFKQNAFAFEPDYTNRPNEAGKAALAVYRTISFANHSCVPNAVLHIDTRDGGVLEGQARLVATQDIAAGKEICVNYLSEHWWYNRSERSDSLWKGWKFFCCFPACQGPEEAAYEAELNLARVYHIGRHALKDYRIRSYVNVLVAVGKWDKDVWLACSRWARICSDNGEWENGVMASRIALHIEEHYFVKENSVPLKSCLDKCLANIEILRNARVALEAGTNA